MKISRKEWETGFKKIFVGQVALELFSQKSFDRVSMDDIARQAEFGKGTLYKLFSGKEEIMAYVICQGIEELCRELQEQCLGGSDVRKSLQTLLELEYNFYSGYSNLVLALVFRQGDDLEPGFPEQVREQNRRHLQLLEQILDQARSAGRQFAMDNQELIRALQAAMKGVMISHIERPSTDKERELERHKDLQLITAMLGNVLLS